MRDKRATLMGEGMFMTVFDALPTDAIVTIIIYNDNLNIITLRNGIQTSLE